MSSQQRSRRLAAAKERLASRAPDDAGRPVRPSFDAQPTIPLTDAIDRLFRSDTSIPAPPVEDIPSEVEISRWEAATHRALFSQRVEGMQPEPSVPPPPPPPVGKDNLRESLDSLPPLLALATPSQEPLLFRETLPVAVRPPELTDELDVSTPGKLRDELDTSRPPPMSSAASSTPAFVIAPDDLAAPAPGSALDTDAGELVLEDEVPPQAHEPASDAVVGASKPNAKSVRGRVVVFGAGALTLLAAGVWAATTLFTPEIPAIAREPAPPPARPHAPPPPPPVAKTEPAVKPSAAEPATKVELPPEKPAPEPTPTPPVTATAPKLIPLPDVAKPEPAKPEPVAKPLLTAKMTPEPVAKPSQASSTPVVAPTPSLAPKRSAVVVDKLVVKPRPAREPPPPAPTPEPAATGAAKLTATESAQTVAAARRKLGEDDAEGAEELMRQLLQHEPRNDQALDVLARALIDQDRGAAAAAVAEKLVALRPRSVGYLLLLGDALLMKGDDAGAKSAWRKALELRPGDAGATQRLGL